MSKWGMMESGMLFCRGNIRTKEHYKISQYSNRRNTRSAKMAFSTNITRPSSPQLPSPVDDHLSAALHAALTRVHKDMHPKDKSHHDKSRIDIIPDSDVLALKGTAVDVEPALLSGHLVLTLSEATSIKEINLQFRGKARIPPHLNDPYVLSFIILLSH